MSIFVDFCEFWQLSRDYPVVFAGDLEEYPNNFLSVFCKSYGWPWRQVGGGGLTPKTHFVALPPSIAEFDKEMCLFCCQLIVEDSWRSF